MGARTSSAGWRDPQEKVQHACDEGHILRTHVLRPTWHFVAAADIRWLLSLRDADHESATGPAGRACRSGPFEKNLHASFHLTPQKYLRKLPAEDGEPGPWSTRATALAEIASGCGFSDQSHFTREFRRHFGRTPRDYREHYARGRSALPLPFQNLTLAIKSRPDPTPLSAPR